MERLNFANKKIIFIFAGLFIFAMVTFVMSTAVTKLHHLPAFSYITMILIWAVSIRRRIVDDRIRHRILTACLFMVFLFFLRMCKFSYFPYDVYVNEYLWYGYTIPLTSIPTFFFLAALNVEPIGNAGHIGIVEKLLIAINALIAIVVMTNYYHSFVYRITVHPDKEYTHEWFYWVILVYRVGLSIGIVYVLLKKCSLSAARKKWYIPVICIAVSCTLLGWYLIVGGSPKIAGHKLFQLHEAVCIPFIIAFESIIQMGLIPANSGYRRLFDNSGISACIYDNKDNPVLVSGDRLEVQDDEDHRVGRETISGGYITWTEDLSLINRLNHEIEDVTEELADENELIQKENEIRAERISFEERNRLYNRIATAVRTRAVKTNSLLTEAMDSSISEDDLRGKIIYASVLGAYIKRMGNLMLLTDGKSSLSSAELGASLRESIEYLGLNGCSCFIYEKDRSELSSSAILLAYELFEDAIEDVWRRLHAISINLEQKDVFEMTIEMDAAAEAISPAWKDREIRATGCGLSVKYEDETYFIRFMFPALYKTEGAKEVVI